MPINRRQFLGGMTAGGALLAGASLLEIERAWAQQKAAGEKGAARPNFVFILTDDQRKGAMGHDGNRLVATPHLDRLAREGMAFERAFVSTPVCSPSRGSILTGQYPHTHGVRRNSPYDALSHRLITFPRLLREAGYHTAHVGKWHMGQDATPRPGYDRWVCLKGQGEYFDPTLNIDGAPTATRGYVTDILTDYAVEFLHSEHGGRPFCLYLGHKAVHGPYTPAPRHATEFARDAIARAPGASRPGEPTQPGDLEGKPAIKAGLEADEGARSPSDESIRKTLRSMMAVDEGLGRILAALKESGQDENTLVIFFSDNGYFWGEHGLGEKRLAYDEAIGVPFLARCPSMIAAGSSTRAFALNIDLAPTLLELAQVPIPTHVQGRSLVPLLRGRTPPGWRQSFLTEFEPTAREPFPAWQAARTEDWKLIRYRGVEGADELYHLRDDPREIKNLIREPGAQAELRKMQAELERLLAQTSTQKPAVTEPTA